MTAASESLGSPGRVLAPARTAEGRGEERGGEASAEGAGERRNVPLVAGVFAPHLRVSTVTAARSCVPGKIWVERKHDT